MINIYLGQQPCKPLYTYQWKGLLVDWLNACGYEPAPDFMVLVDGVETQDIASVVATKDSVIDIYLSKY